MNSYHIVPINAISAVTVEGGLDLESTHRLVEGLARDAPGKSLLMDFRDVPTAFSYSDIYQIVQLISEQGAWTQNRLAVLDDYDAEFDKTQFMEAAAEERDLQIRAFIDPEEAIAWLEAWTAGQGE